MCNDFGNRIPYDDYLRAFSHTRLPVRWPTAAPNLESRDDIWPTDSAPVIRRLEDGINEFKVLRGGFRLGDRSLHQSSTSGLKAHDFRSAGVWCRPRISSS